MSRMTGQAEKGTTFAALHDGEPFVIPNPWDVGSARILAARVPLGEWLA
jgi:2-methylisocitrate lyase-like PEP mutase family enzyme